MKFRESAEKYSDFVISPFDEINRVYGYETVEAICDYFGGATTYIPTLASVFSDCVKKAIVDEFAGNVRELARKYGVSDSFVRRALRQDRACMGRVD